MVKMMTPSYALADLVVDEVEEEQTDSEGVVVETEVPGNHFQAVDQLARQIRGKAVVSADSQGRQRPWSTPTQ